MSTTWRKLLDFKSGSEIVTKNVTSESKNSSENSKQSSERDSGKTKYNTLPLRNLTRNLSISGTFRRLKNVKLFSRSASISEHGSYVNSELPLDTNQSITENQQNSPITERTKASGSTGFSQSKPPSPQLQAKKIENQQEKPNTSKTKANTNASPRTSNTTSPRVSADLAKIENKPSKNSSPRPSKPTSPRKSADYIKTEARQSAICNTTTTRSDLNKQENRQNYCGTSKNSLNRHNKKPAPNPPTKQMATSSSSFNKNLQCSHMNTSTFTKEELKGPPKCFPGQKEEDAQNTQQLQKIPLSKKPDAAESLSKSMEKNLIISENYNQPIKKPDESNQEIKGVENSNISIKEGFTNLKNTELFTVKNLEIEDVENFESLDNSETNDESENTPVLEEITLGIESQQTIQETKRPQEMVSGVFSANHTYIVTTINAGNIIQQERIHLGDQMGQNQSSSASVISENPLCITQYNPAEPIRPPRKCIAMGDKRKNDLDEPLQNKRLNTSSGSSTSSPERCEKTLSDQLFQDAEECVGETVSRLSIDSVNQEVNNFAEDTVNETGSVEVPNEGCITDESVTEPSTSSNPEENNIEVIKSSNEHTECQDEKHSEFVQKSLAKIEAVLLEVKELEAEMDIFPGTDENDRDYVYMDEVMMRSMIKLDNIDTNNDPKVRKKRKEGIQFIQHMMAKLDEKLRKNKEKQPESRQNSQTSDVDHDDEEDGHYSKNGERSDG